MNKAFLLFNEGKQILKSGGIEAYAFDAACLFLHFCGISRAEIPITDKVPERCDEFIAACKKRCSGYPLQYIIGKWEFYGTEFEVSEQVLIPRADTETLIDYVLENYSGNISVLDMCCGSGCIGLTLKKHLPDADVTLCDISGGALKVTRKNAKNLGLSVTVRKADVLEDSKKYFKDGSFDIIISNPPYIKSADMENLSAEVLYEPGIALDGGEDGMKFYTALAEGWMKALKPNGEMIFESGYDTAKDIETLFTELCCRDIKTRKDLGGITRLVAAGKPSFFCTKKFSEFLPNY